MKTKQNKQKYLDFKQTTSPEMLAFWDLWQVWLGPSKNCIIGFGMEKKN